MDSITDKACEAQQAFASYPQTRHSKELEYDEKRYDENLKEDAERLFTPVDSGTVNIDVLVSQNSGSGSVDLRVNQNGDQIGELLSQGAPKSAELFFNLKPEAPRMHSLSKLHLTEKCMRKILSTYRVSPAILDNLHAYGKKVNARRDTTSSACKHKFHYKLRKTDGVARTSLSAYDVCYSISYVVKNNRPNSTLTEPKKWSIRQMTVSQKHSFDDNSDAWILVKPTGRTMERIQEACEAEHAEEETDVLPKNPLEKHLIFLSMAGEGWRNYYNTCEEWFLDYTANSVLYQVESQFNSTISKPSKPEGAASSEKAPIKPPQRRGTSSLEVSFKNVQMVQQFSEDLQYFRTCLLNNEAAIQKLRSINTSIHNLRSSDEKDLYHASYIDFDSTLESLIGEIQQHQRNVESLMATVRSRSRLLYEVLEFQTHERVSLYGQLAHDFQMKGRKDTDLMVNMSKKTTTDAVGMKIITFVALMYLPCTFVATFLSSGILDFEENSKSIDFKAVRFSKESFLIFALATVPLTVITLLGWHLWNKRELKKMENRWDKSGFGIPNLADF